MKCHSYFTKKTILGSRAAENCIVHTRWATSYMINHQSPQVCGELKIYLSYSMLCSFSLGDSIARRSPLCPYLYITSHHRIAINHCKKISLHGRVRTGVNLSKLRNKKIKSTKSTTGRNRISTTNMSMKYYFFLEPPLPFSYFHSVAAGRMKTECLNSPRGSCNIHNYLTLIAGVPWSPPDLPPTSPRLRTQWRDEGSSKSLLSSSNHVEALLYCAAIALRNYCITPDRKWLLWE